MIPPTRKQERGPSHMTHRDTSWRVIISVTIHTVHAYGCLILWVFFFYLREKSFFPLCSRNILALILVPYPFSTVAKWMMYSLNFCKAQILCGQGRKSLAAYEEGREGSSSTLKAMGGGGLASFFSTKACLLPNCRLLEGRRLGLSLVELEGAVLKPDAPDGLVFHGEERGFFFFFSDRKPQKNVLPSI